MTAGGGDETVESFEGWYQEVHTRIATAVRLMTGDRDLAVEAADEALVRAYERWSRVSEMASPEAWTVRVALNVARRRLRRRAVERRLLLREQHHAQVDSEPSDEGLWSAVRALPTRQRTAIALRYVADLKEQDIAEAMGVSRSTVSTTLRDAQSRLESQLNTTAHPPERQTEDSDARPA